MTVAASSSEESFSISFICVSTGCSSHCASSWAAALRLARSPESLSFSSASSSRGRATVSEYVLSFSCLGIPHLLEFLRGLLLHTLGAGLAQDAHGGELSHLLRQLTIAGFVDEVGNRQLDAAAASAVAFHLR